ncbi:hypothetical protein [Pseudomonas aeruginosa]
MKPKTTFSLFDSKLVRFPPSSLYLTDIERLILIGADRGLNVKISDSTDEFDDLTDLIENRGKRIKSLNLIFSANSLPSILNNVIKLEIGEKGISLRSANDDKLLPAWLAMKTYIENHEPIYAPLMKPTVWLLIVLGVLAVLPRLSWAPSESFARVLILAVPAWLCLYSAYYLKKTSVYLQKKHEIEGFWDRNGEKILLAVFSALIGAVLSVAGQLIVQKVLTK